MRRRPALLLVAVCLPALVLSACGKDTSSATPTGSTSGTSSSAPSPTSSWSGDLPTVDGAFGKESTITVPKGSAPGDLQVDRDRLSVEHLRPARRTEISISCDEQLVVEYYAR